MMERLLDLWLQFVESRMLAKVSTYASSIFSSRSDIIRPWLVLLVISGEINLLSIHSHYFYLVWPSRKATALAMQTMGWRSEEQLFSSTLILFGPPWPDRSGLKGIETFMLV